MKIVLADDEPLARSRLRRLLGEIPECRLLAEAGDGDSLLEAVRRERPDIVLLDIHMPGMDGLHAARELSAMDPPPAIIFTTAHSQHALTAFGTAASGYLLKPINRKQLEQALRKARTPSRAQLGADVNETPDEHIEVRERGRLLRVPLSAVIYCQAEDKYTRLVWEGGTHLIDTSLRQLEARFPKRLMRVHRKVLVTPAAVRGLERHAGGQRLLLRGSNDQPPVSRRMSGAVRALLKGG